MMTTPSMPVLDNPVWHALRSHQARLAFSTDLAARYPAAVSPFAALREDTPDAFAQLARLLQADEAAFILAKQPLAGDAALGLEPLFTVLQMVDTLDAADAPADDALSLGPADAAEMLDLALRTKPGPFAPRTPEMGRYIGIREAGRLIAMAGERFRPPGATEISAVCVDDACRGRGIAGRLMGVLRRDIRSQAAVPFLHVRSDAPATIRLYERLGFEVREAFLLHRAVRR